MKGKLQARLSRAGYPHTVELAAATRMLYQHHHGRSPSVNEALAFLADRDRNALVTHTGEASRLAYRIGGAHKAALAFCRYVLFEEDRGSAERFFGDLKDGYELGKGDPVLELRETFLQRYRRCQRPFTGEQTSGMIFSAWAKRRIALHAS